MIGSWLVTSFVSPGAFHVTEPILASALVHSTATGLLSSHTVATKYPSWQKCMSPYLWIIYSCYIIKLINEVYTYLVLSG